MDPEAARKDLDRRGIPFSEEQFLRQVRSGNVEITNLFLGAGISPNASLDGKAALQVAAEAGHHKIAEALLSAGANPTPLLRSAMKANAKAKDGWDRLASLSGLFTFMSSIMVAIVGWYFTSSYNERQLQLATSQARQEQQNKAYQNRLAEMQTVEKMIPHLAGSEPSKRSALVALSVLATPDLAAKIAEIYGGEGAVDALKQIAAGNQPAASAPAISALTNLASQESDPSNNAARAALGSVLQGKERALALVTVKDGQQNSPICNGFVVDAVRGWIVTPGYCLQTMPTSDFSIQQSDGSIVPVSERKFSRGNLLALLRMESAASDQLDLSVNTFRPGDTVTRLAFDLLGDARTRTVIATVGRVIEVGAMNFIGDIEGGALRVTLPAEAEQVRGAAGAPLFDHQGNVACMTFQGGPALYEQCVAAAEIRRALQEAGLS